MPDPGRDGPILIQVTSGDIESSPQIAALVADVRRSADAFIFLSGGASSMPERTRLQLLHLLDALSLLANRGLRFAVGDGGTKAGLMEAAGCARLAAASAFPLIGVAPAPEIMPLNDPAKTPIDPHHSHVVAVDNPAWVASRRGEGWTPEQGFWGLEVDAMYTLFDRLSFNRPAVTLIANGGAVALQEVRKNVQASRKMILVAGSGRAADALVSLLTETVPEDAEVEALGVAARSDGLISNPDLYEIFTASDGASALADTIARHLV